MKEKKKHTLLILIVFLALALLIVLFVTSWVTVSFNPVKQGWKTIPEEERKTPTLENVIAYDRAASGERIRPQDYFAADSLGWLVDSYDYGAPQKQTSLYCGDPENPEGIVPWGDQSITCLYDYCYEPVEMYGKPFETRFLCGEGVLHSAAYVCRAETPEALLPVIRETAGQISRQFSIETSAAASSALESPEAFEEYVRANQKEAEVWRNGKPFAVKQRYAVIGDYTGTNFPGTLRITVHIPEIGDPYAVFVWQKEQHTLLFEGSVCRLNPTLRREGNYIYLETPGTNEERKIHYLDVREAFPQNFALDY